MNHTAASDLWILSQLSGIRMLEQELMEGMKRPGAEAGVMQRRVEQLNAWLNVVENALSARASQSHRVPA